MSALLRMAAHVLRRGGRRPSSPSTRARLLRERVLRDVSELYRTNWGDDPAAVVLLPGLTVGGSAGAPKIRVISSLPTPITDEDLVELATQVAARAEERS
jgi:hypothetical protein